MKIKDINKNFIRREGHETIVENILESTLKEIDDRENLLVEDVTERLFDIIADKDSIGEISKENIFSKDDMDTHKLLDKINTLNGKLSSLIGELKVKLRDIYHHDDTDIVSGMLPINMDLLLYEKEFFNFTNYINLELIPKMKTGNLKSIFDRLRIKKFTDYYNSEYRYDVNLKTKVEKSVRKEIPTSIYIDALGKLIDLDTRVINRTLDTIKSLEMYTTKYYVTIFTQKENLDHQDTCDGFICEMMRVIVNFLEILIVYTSGILNLK